MTRKPIFGPPSARFGSSVRHAEISKSLHRFFYIFGTELGLPNATKVTFSDSTRKIPFGRFWPIFVKNSQFWPKINVSANFLNLVIGFS